MEDFKQKKLAKLLYGSQNYNLDGEESDRDYKIICAPSFQQLYYRENASGPDVWDFRLFSKRVIEGNFNAMELLFTVEKEFYDDCFAEWWYFLRANASRICEARKSTFYKSAQGLFNSCLARAEKATDEKGYVKQMARATYILDFLNNLRYNHFVMNENCWRGLFSMNARQIRFHGAPVDKFELMYQMNDASFYFSQKDEPLSSLSEQEKEYFRRIIG